MTVIGLGHIAGVGKDEVAAHLVEKYGFTRVSIADLIREVCMGLNPYVEGAAAPLFIRYVVALDMYGAENAKRNIPEVRRLQQEVGQVMRRIFGDDFWVDQIDRKITGVGGRVVVTDVRFRNEIEMIEHNAGFTVRIDRPGYEALDHITDRALLGYNQWDYILDNDGDLDQLHRRVDYMMDLIETDADRVPVGTINIAEHWSKE